MVLEGLPVVCNWSQCCWTQRLVEDDTNVEVTEKLEGGADIYANSGFEDSLINSIPRGSIILRRNHSKRHDVTLSA